MPRDERRARLLLKDRPNPALQSALAKVSARLRLQSSPQSGGDWTSAVDVIAGNNATSNAARRPAVGASANGLPIATFNGVTPDVWSWPLNAANNGTTHWGIGLWIKPSTIGVVADLAAIFPGTAGANLSKIIFKQSFAALACQVNVANPDGRTFTTGAALSAGAWAWVRADWTSARSGDDRIRIYVGGTQQSGSYANLGAGGFPTDLRVATGNMLVANENDSALVANPFTGSYGPNLYAFSADLTAAEEIAIMNLERPT